MAIHLKLLKPWQRVFTGITLSAVLTWPARAVGGEVLPATARGDYVVLIHGLGRTAWSMKGLQWALERKGYRTINSSYPSTRLSIDEAADLWLDGLLQERLTDRTVNVHFVTHSLGAIVLRQYLRDHSLENLGRVVMLAPPNGGSELADRFRQNPLYRFLTGPAGQEIGTDKSSLPNQPGPANFAPGIIAGDRSLNPIFSKWIPGPDDGKVSVQRTRLDSMKDFLVVHHSHTWLMWNKNTIDAVMRFLSEGRMQ